ncbi:hypothetical protein GCK72_020261 [Caenorhabditis remanei]|uniref:Uncharacterized protein n=1 Tax=Caenorhabditis remanei TaxID=31234 RepID=A0A6A5GG17_CAERE|nr:hypothetical protein GCK72_020261 [Caenorhabditis remanei]KAF1753704.1 hypothetical protein GCK72_020261 [Caenorhabditis remanei]
MGNCRAKGTVGTSPMVTRAQRRAQAAANRANAGPPPQANPAPAAPANANHQRVVRVAPVNQARQQANQDRAGVYGPQGNQARRSPVQGDYGPSPRQSPNAHRDHLPRRVNRPTPQPRSTSQGQGGGQNMPNVE